MEAKTITYFDWEDVELEICKEMNIDPDNFRSYHKVIGGEYKDLWHEWMNIFQSRIENGSINPVDVDQDMLDVIEYAKSKDKEWLEPFIKAVYKICEKHEIEYIMHYW